MSERQAVFLDRDGTLIRDTGYVGNPAQVELLPNAIAGLKLLRAGPTANSREQPVGGWAW